VQQTDGVRFLRFLFLHPLSSKASLRCECSVLVGDSLKFRDGGTYPRGPAGLLDGGLRGRLDQLRRHTHSVDNDWNATTGIGDHRRALSDVRCRFRNERLDRARLASASRHGSPPFRHRLSRDATYERVKVH
jgi:hypothetical protein